MKCLLNFRLFAISVVLGFVTLGPIHAEERILTVDYRNRPPEMVIKNGVISGPIHDIVTEAAASIGYRIQWKIVPFPRSLKKAENGILDILPRIQMNPERSTFLLPILFGYQDKSVYFLVKKGRETLINDYEDLRHVSVGVKRGSSYFVRFNNDQSINKIYSLDDMNMGRMFALNRFDTMIVIEKPPIINVLRRFKIKDYSWANYVYHQEIGRYFGLSSKSPHVHLYHDLQEAMLKLRKDGRISAIYATYGLPPLKQYYR